MKLHIENMETKIESYSSMKKENKYLNEKVKKLKDTKKENEIIILKAENKNLKGIIEQKEMEYDQMEKEFSEKISELNKNLQNYEEKFKYQNQNQSQKNESENDKSVILNKICIINHLPSRSVKFFFKLN